jgi:hypothetical protein
MKWKWFRIVKFKRFLQKVRTLLMMIIRRTYSLILLISSMEWMRIMQLGHLMDTNCLYSYLSYFQRTATDFKCFHSLFQNLKFLISVAHFISSALFQLYIFVLVCLENFSFAHYINFALMEQIEL